MDISALFIKHLPVSNQYVICILQNGEVQTVNKNHTNFDSACKALNKMARTQKNLFYLGTENLYLNITKITAVRAVKNDYELTARDLFYKVVITCDGRDFTVLYCSTLFNANNYRRLLSKRFNLKEEN